jgi:hypothetical protein
MVNKEGGTVFKTRSKFGKFVDRNGYTQKEIIEISKLGKNTVTRLCSDSEYRPRGDTFKKLIRLIEKIDSKAEVDDFFDM